MSGPQTPLQERAPEAGASRRVSHHSRPTLLVGTGRRAEFAAREVAAARDGFSIIGIITHSGEAMTPRVAGLPVLGSSDQIEHIVRHTGARAVVVALENGLTPQFDRQLDGCRDLGAEILDTAELIESLAGRVPLSCVRSDWLEETLEARTPGPFYAAVKRVLDLVLGSVALALFAPVFPFLALAIWRSTGGSPILAQERVGRHGRIIRIFKLRSMISNAECPGRPVWAESDDQRVTRLGRWLRRTRLDEVPQFANVLAGQMSVVGPRPERPFFVDQLQREIPCFDWRHVVRPGITGWAQVNQGYAASMAESMLKLEHDLYYIKHRSPSLELRILWKTILVVLYRRGR